MRETLVLARPRRRRWRPLIMLAVLAVVCLPAAVRGADRLLAVHYTNALTDVQAENAALRTELAQSAALEMENEALRALLGSERVQGSWQPQWAAAHWPGGFALAGAAEVGAAVVDPQGRYAGEVTASTRWLCVVTRGTPAGLAGGTMGLLQGRTLTGLAVNSGLTAGSVVYTPGGLWLGRLAAAPENDASGLTAHAPLTDTAGLGELLYFVQR
ncbi:MAG: hypothetical protein ACI4OI_06500 [Gemmiger sp.]